MSKPIHKEIFAAAPVQQPYTRGIYAVVGNTTPLIAKIHTISYYTPVPYVSFNIIKRKHANIIRHLAGRLHREYENESSGHNVAPS